ncbi:M1 family metallopeptidase [Streptomyces olivaceoviridis]|uniref:M1 family metallopeptidase n=1 Tax=Streptomyces olivaceoviridis TaxID=1921 RepID=UPI0036FFD5C4
MRRVPFLVGTVVLCLLLAPSPASGADGRSGLGDPYFPEDGNSGYDVAHYDVRIAYDPAHPDRLTGDTTVTARATDDLDRFNLDLTGFDVSAVTVDGRPAREVAREGDHELVVTPAQRLSAGSTFAVRVRYSGRPVGEGWHQLADGGADVAGEPHSATAWYPANDHPSDKATFSLTATVPEGWTAIGNGRPGPVTTDGAGHRTFRWHEDHPMVGYASTVAIDRFTVHTSVMKDGTPVITAYSPDALIDPDAEAQQTEILEFLASRFGPYPFSSAGAIAVTHRAGDGPVDLETQSRPTYDSGLFDVAMAHEIAHQWFGDSVSFTDWRDGCISECFAQYANWLWYEHQGDDIDRDYYVPVVAEHRDDHDFWSVPLYDPGPGRQLDKALYDRGQLMLHALRRTVGDDLFFTILRRWQRDHRYGNASWPQFEALAEKTAGQDLTGFFAAWAHGTTIPADKYLYPGTLGSATAGQ